MQSTNQPSEVPGSAVLTVDDGFRLAIEHHRAGRLNEAEVLYRGILQANPAHPDANHNLGLIAVQTGHVDASLPLFKAALDACPDFPPYWISYIDAMDRAGQSAGALELLRQARQKGMSGEAMEILAARLNLSGSELSALKSRLVEAFNRGEYAEAETLAREMTRNHPNEAIGWKVMGAALTQMGRIPEALVPMQKTLQLTPQDAEAHFNYAIALRHSGDLSQAEASFRQAIEIRHDYAEAHNNLGNLLRELGRLDEAEASLKRAIEANPDYAAAHFNLANLLIEMGRVTDAEACLRQSLILNPEQAEACYRLGNALYEQGRLAEAQASFQQAIDLRPDFAEPLNDLGIVLGELGRTGEAMLSYRRALEIKPDFAECHRNLSELKTYAQDDPDIPLLRRLHGSIQNRRDRMLICFALGKACEDIGEYDEAFALYEEGNSLRRQELGYTIEQDRALFARIEKAFEILPETEPVSMKGVQPILIVGMTRSGTSLVEQILASHSAVFGAGEKNALGLLAVKHFLEDEAAIPDLPAMSRAIAAEYFEQMNSIGDEHEYVTDKMPLNFRWLGFLLLANPDLRIIHTIRDPMATCWSNFRQFFPAKGLGFICDLADLAEYYTLYRKLMAFWNEKFPGRIYDLDYERLTEHQEEETRKLLDYCGLHWEEACLEFEKTERAVRTASSTQVRKKLYKGSSSAWKRFEKHLEPLKEGLRAGISSLQRQELIREFGREDYAEAERLALKMTQDDPLDGFGWKALGAALYKTDRKDEALFPMQEAARLMPGDAETHNNLGNLLLDLGRQAEAEGSCRRAIEIQPDYAAAHSNLGIVLLDLGRLDEAASSLGRAVAIQPDFAVAHNNLGAALDRLGRTTEAEACYRKAIELNPAYADAYNNLGTALNDMGRTKEAESAYRRAIELQPDFAECYNNLGQLGPCTSDDSRIPALRRILEKPCSDRDRMHACFALGKAMDDTGQYDEAFALYEEGNALRKKELGYGIEQDRMLFDRIMAAFEKLPETDQVSLRETQPILIVGMPRSGTSLAEQILASHSEVFGAGELETLNELAQARFLDAAHFDLATASREITSAYLEELDRISEGRRHVADKMPLNFRWLGFLLLANPDIKVVHTIRDPMATCWSVFKQYFPAKGLGFAWDIDDLAEYYKLYEELMRFWCEKFPGRIYDLDYEKLTENQEGETRKLLDYCGLSWEEACLDFHRTERVVKTASAAQVRKKMYKGSSEAWKKFEKHLGPLKTGLGRT